MSKTPPTKSMAELMLATPAPTPTPAAPEPGERITYTNTILRSDNEALKNAAYWRRLTERELLDEMFAAWVATQEPADLRPRPPKKEKPRR